MLECVVRELVRETLYRVRVRRVTLESDVELVDNELLLSVMPETVILWIGHDNLDVGATVLIPVGPTESLEVGALLCPPEITLQSVTGVTF